MDENSNTTQINELLFNEAPASWNTRYVDPHGFECQITLRAVSGQELLEKVSGAISHLLENECVPYSYRGGYRGNPNKVSKDGNNKGDGQSNSQAWCPIHQCEMRFWEKDDKSWYSHKVDDSWCYGRKERS